MLEADMLEELTGLAGPSGHEEPVIRYMKKKFEELNGQADVDKMGNVYTVVKGKSDEKLMIFAHMDEVGLLVEKIQANGFLKINRLGGIPIKVLPGTRIIFADDEGQREPVEGFVGIKAHHFTPAEEKYRVNNIEELYIDIGAKSKEEVLSLGINIGSVATYKPNFTYLASGRVTSKALDNRGGCFALLALLAKLTKEKPEKTVIIAGTVLEEFNQQGVIPLAYRIKPEAAIGVDIAVACDTPDLVSQNDISLGEARRLGSLVFTLEVHWPD